VSTDHDDHEGADHGHGRGGGHSHSHGRDADARSLRLALVLLLVFMAGEITVGLLSNSLALLSDAAHMLTDAAALAIGLLASRLAAKPAGGKMTYGLGRAEVLSAQANGLTMLVLGFVIVYGGIVHLFKPADVDGWPVLIVALVGIVVNLVATRILRGDGDHERSMNVEGSYRHIVTDLFAFVATAIAAGVLIATGFHRADAIASLMIAALMIYASFGLLVDSTRVMMEAAPAGLDPDAIGLTLASQAGVAEVHDLHIWEVTSDFSSISAHIVVEADHDCHEVRRQLSRLLDERYGLSHSTLQVEHAHAKQPPLQIEVGSLPA
jgi:cobalt-zinc-cadmium efflux system protein